MRLSDFSDWYRLRAHLARPWAFVRLRTRTDRPPVYEVPFRNGRTFRLRNVPMDYHVFHRIFARDEYGVDGVAPGSFDTVIDLGGHVGSFAVRAAPLARRVLTFEPHPGNFELLKQNIEPYPNVSARCVAVAGKRGTATLHVSDMPAAHSLYRPKAARAMVGTAQVETITLADILLENGVERCDLLKIDVEGAEYDLLLALPDELWPRIRRIAMEYDPLPNAPPTWNIEHLARFLSEKGQRVNYYASKRHADKGHLFSVRAD
jgi:FkbM family methyltransferase